MKRLAVALALVLTIGAGSASATLAIDSQESASAGHRLAGSPLTWSFTNTAGNLLVCAMIATDQTGTVTLNTPTYNGVSMSAVGSQVATDTNHTKLGLFSLLSPATGSNTVSVSGSGGSGNFALLGGCLSFSGADGTTPLGTAVSGTGTSATSATGNITNTSGNYLVAAVSTGTSAPTAASGNTLTFNKVGSTNTGGDNIGAETWPATGTTRNMQMAQTSDVWGAIGVEVKAAAGGGGATCTHGMLGVFSCDEAAR